MRQPSQRIRSRRLLKLLKDLQEDDYTITAPTLLAAKHLLQHHTRCTLVEVKIDLVVADCSAEVHRNLVPNFIVSQLEEQKLTDRSSENVVVSPIAAFVILSLPGTSGRERGYPTLFRWYCPPRHRTYYLFAYLKRDMARRTYTLSELLRLRRSYTSNDIAALIRNPEFADVVRRSGSESSAASCKPMAGRHKDDSSVTSDELLFKGTVSRRSGRELAREPSRNPIRAPTREPAPAHPRESIREPTNKTSQHMEWKYRGRSKTEAVSTEPIPAPGGATAQRSEGFQRFYKAVVSPTHVRVTAGGRIVPNTRGPPSPTTTRTNDNPAADSQSVPDKATSGRPSLNPIGVGQPATAVPQLIPGYPPGFQPIQTPVSFVPMAFGAHLPPGVSFAQHASNPSTVNPPVTGALTADNILKDMHNTKSTDARTEGYVTDDKQGNVKISPHELFDYTKPYYYNGQIIYPVGPFPPSLGNPMVPIHMVGVPHGLPHGLPHGVSQSIHHGATLQLPGHYQSQPTSATPTVTGTSYAPSNNGLGGIPFAVRHVAPGNANPNAAIAPPPSSIKLSDITKKQISSFKQSLKYHEDQLQYNRHQIDEKDMETRIQTIMGHIQRFETTLKSQLEYEEAQRKAGRGEEDDIPSQSAAAAEGDQAWAQPAPSPEPGVNIMNESDEAIRRRVALASYGLNTNIGEGGKAVFRCPTEPAFPITNAQTMGLSLPSEAALAPAFQPRGYSSSWEGSEHAREKAAKEEAEKQFLTAESRKFEHMGASAQRSISHPFATPYLAMLPRVEGNYEAPTSTNRTGNNSIGKHLRPNLGVPYLLGTLPKDVNPRTARDQDYVYKRPLTEEERRARFLYWGKAPKSAVKGLPKFDGKHFYPPSPVKERPAVFSQEGAPDGHRSIDHRQAESDCDPFRSMTPVERIDSRVVTASEDNCIANRHSRTISFDTQVNSGSEDSQMTGGAPLMYRESSLDASSVGSAERRSEKSGAKLWQAVLRKGPTSSALSSTTVQGLLPHYAGHAAASLSPSFNTNQGSSVKETSPGKSPLSDHGGVLVAAGAEQRDENCPPHNVSSIQSQLNDLSLDVSGRNLAPAFGI